MSNFIVFTAITSDEVNDTSFALLKLLGLYNLKPPTELSVAVCTSRPAQLELYKPFFKNFLFLDPGKHSTIDLLNNFAHKQGGNILYFGRGMFPTSKPDTAFSDINTGTVYMRIVESHGDKKAKYLGLAGWNPSKNALNPDADGTASPGNFADNSLDLPEFKVLLRLFLSKHAEESLPSLVKLATSLDVQKIRDQKTAFSRLPMFRKLLLRFRGKHFSIGNYLK